jgi:hypothetical protein
MRKKKLMRVSLLPRRTKIASFGCSSDWLRHRRNSRRTTRNLRAHESKGYSRKRGFMTSLASGWRHSWRSPKWKRSWAMQARHRHS